MDAAQKNAEIMVRGVSTILMLTYLSTMQIRTYFAMKTYLDMSAAKIMGTIHGWLLVFTTLIAIVCVIALWFDKRWALNGVLLLAFYSLVMLLVYEVPMSLEIGAHFVMVGCLWWKRKVFV